MGRALSMPRQQHAFATDLDAGFAGALFIAPARTAPDGPAPLLVREFTLPEGFSGGMLRITALGIHRAMINGVRATDHELAPGWTDYRHRVTWSEYDVAPLLRVGANRVEILLGNGWYRGRLGRPARRDLYGADVAALARLSTVDADGTARDLVTDEDWSWVESTLVADDLYDGCVIDLSHTPGPERAVRPLTYAGRIEKAVAPPVRPLEVTPTRAIGRTPSGARLVDVGVNTVGWLRLRVHRRDVAREIVVRHAEVLDGGDLALRPLRQAAATDVYRIPAGAGVDELEAVHTFHGFRYARIEGLDEDEQIEVEAVSISSDLPETGTWSSSHPLLNRLHENVRRSARGNFVSIPTDCPQRDERLGWTADIQVFAPTATYLFDVSAFLGSWLDDLSAGQSDDGSVPVVVPDIYRRESVATAGWGDAAVVVPWELYRAYGDVAQLRRSWPAALRWLERVDRAVDAHGIWRGGHQYGDWLDPNAPPERPAEALTDPDLVATAYRVRSLDLAHRWAQAIDDRGRAGDLSARYARARSQFRERFVTPRGFLTSESQAAYALAICFGLLDDDQLGAAGDRLADLVRRTDFTVGTGFLGTPVLLEALSRTGHERVAMRMLLAERTPSWLAPLRQGATTIWERWDSMLEDGTVNPGEMTSFNHYAFGAVADWMHGVLGGLRAASPGWRSATITPPVWSPLDHVATSHRSAHGQWAVRWRREGDGRLALRAEIPPGCTAEVGVGAGRTLLGEGVHHLAFDRPSDTRRSGAATVRDVMDDEAAWRRVTAAVRAVRPEWSSRDLAREAFAYLDLPLPALARAVGMSIPTHDEDRVRRSLADIAKNLL